MAATETRQDLIDRYRQRIAEGKRTRLTKPERADLAQSFVELLADCETEAEAMALCTAEIALLEEGYPIPSIANQYLPEWRKSIASAIDQGQLPQQTLEPNEFGKTYAHWGLKYLLYDNDTYRELKQETTTANNRKQDNLKPIRANRIIATARYLLQGDSPHEWAAGLIVLTGRRFSEIAAKGTFQATAHPYAIAFSGQLKKPDGWEDAAYVIPTLIEAGEILTALDRFRHHPRIRELQSLDCDDINSKLNSSVRHHIQTAFQEPEIIPILDGEKSVSAHNLRGVYGAIATHFFCPPTQSINRFVAAHLGHLIGEARLSGKTPGATEHYFHYYLENSQHQPIHDRGILLDQFPPLPTTHSHSGSGSGKRCRTTTPLWHDEKDRWNRIFDEIAPASEGLRKEDRMSLFMAWMEDRLNHPQPEPTPTIDMGGIGSHLQWLTERIESLEAQLKATVAERNRAREALAGSQSTPDAESLEELEREMTPIFRTQGQEQYPCCTKRGNYERKSSSIQCRI
jgi:hypothetical protein